MHGAYRREGKKWQGLREVCSVTSEIQYYQLASEILGLMN